ncbi:glycosyltransferase family 2 protein [soil metagenome]
MSEPLVSLGLPVYNGERYLRQAIESALGQTHGNIELIICDNASTDGTGDIARDYAARDGRVRYFRNPSNVGPIPNFNRAFRLARGDYFKWLAYDDLCLPEMVARCVEVLEADVTVSLCTARFVEIGPDGEMLGPQPYSIELSSRRPYRRLEALMSTPAGHAILYGVIRSDLLSKTRLMAAYHGSDRALLAELCLLGRVVELPDVLWQSRDHPARSTSVRNDIRWDPAQHGAGLRHARMLGHMTRIIATAHLPESERVRCMAVLSRAVLSRADELVPVFWAEIVSTVRHARAGAAQGSPGTSR